MPTQAMLLVATARIHCPPFHHRGLIDQNIHTTIEEANADLGDVNYLWQLHELIAHLSTTVEYDQSIHTTIEEANAEPLWQLPELTAKFSTTVDSLINCTLVGPAVALISW